MKNAFFLMGIALLFAGFGCVQFGPEEIDLDPIADLPMGPSGPMIAASVNDFETPDNDCLGLTAEEVQKRCGSGSLRRSIEPVYDGYVCKYLALHPEGADQSELGVQLKLSYQSGNKDMALLAAELRRGEYGNHVETIKDWQGGLTLQSSGSIDSPWAFDLYRNIGPFTAALYGTEIDYASSSLMDSAYECSHDEMWSLLSFISGEDTAAEATENIGELREVVPEPAMPETNPDETVTSVDCCQIMIVEVKGEASLKKGDVVVPAEKGQILDVGDEIYTGEDSQVVVAFIGCGYGDNEDDVGIAIVQSEHKGEIIDQGGKPAVSFDPGVATVSVYRYAIFETDFQVSTPRLTCSVKG